jgi:hypothetical protein
MSALISATRLRELLRYDPDTGLFTWRVSVGGRGAKAGNGKFKPGQEAGCLDGDGYRVIRLDGRLYRAHRLAWLYMTGEWPALEVDHKYGARSDNRWIMLAEKSSGGNHQNRVCSSGSTGFLGAHLDSRSGKFASSIAADGKRWRLGLFDTPQEAHAAYLTAKLALHPAFERERLSASGGQL